jgi:hypothetical protein
MGNYREIPGFCISKAAYEKAASMLAQEKRNQKFKVATSNKEYLETLLQVAIQLRAKELEATDLKDRLVLTPDEAVQASLQR